MMVVRPEHLQAFLLGGSQLVAGEILLRELQEQFGVGGGQHQVNPLISRRRWHEHKGKRRGAALAVLAHTPMNILPVYPSTVAELERIRERNRPR
jgi:hypothetical protein